MKHTLGLSFLALLAGLVALATQHTFGVAHAQLPGDPIAGGRIYDNWMIALDAPIPQGNHPLWDNQDFNQRSGVITWRCAECHGWDYKGANGAYGPFSDHYTGFRGLENTVGASQAEVIDWLDGTNHDEHNLLVLTNTTVMNDLAAFLRTQQIDTDLIIDPSTGEALGDRSSGSGSYARACASCHGDAGDKINFGTTADPLYLGDRAVADPWYTVHKMRFGIPSGVLMPASEDLGWSLSKVADVLAHLQTLPRGNPNSDFIGVDHGQPIEIENQAQVEPIVWGAFAILTVVAINIGWDFYSSRKSGN
jgi:thiosulfate dehydrogenase